MKRLYTDAVQPDLRVQSLGEWLGISKKRVNVQYFGDPSAIIISQSLPVKDWDSVNE